jgi:hypothetical protein
MQYNKILRLALVPAIVFFVLSLVSVALTVHYWILGDWILPKGIQITTTDFIERTQSYRTDYTVVFYIDQETDATIAAGILCLAAAIMSLIAWSVLRKPDMDTQLAAVSEDAQQNLDIYANPRHRGDVVSGCFPSWS